MRYVQPRRGFRSSLEPVLLAAAIPARSGQRVLEGGRPYMVEMLAQSPVSAISMASSRNKLVDFE